MVDHSALSPTSTATSVQWYKPSPQSRLALLALAMTLIIGCATNDKGTRFGLEDESVWDRSQADGAAFAADSMTFRKSMRIRSKNDFEFYYKRCQLTISDSFISKTSYWCTEP